MWKCWIRITVSEVMQTETRHLLESDPISVATEVFAQTRHHGLPVVDARGELCGILTIQDVERVQAKGERHDYDRAGLHPRGAYGLPR